MKTEIIDTHIHIWDLDRVRYSWLDGDASILNRTYGFEELKPAMIKSPVSTGILVQAANNLADTELMLETARQHQEIIGVVGWLPLTDPVQTAKLLEEKYLKEPLFKGVRHLIHNESDTEWLLQQPVIESLQILASFDIPYDVVGINDEHLKTAIKVGEKIPSLKMVLDHLNQPPIKNNARFGTWGDLMKEISNNSNVYAKISGLGTASGDPANWTAALVAPYIAYVIETFGISRCFCGGDWPVSALAGSYASHWEKYTAAINSVLSTEEASTIYSKAATHFYKLY